MITDCVMWVGRMVPTYQDEIDEWMEQDDSIDREILHVSDIDLSGEYGNTFVDSSGMFGAKTVLIMDAQNWKAAEAQDALSKFQNMNSEVRVAMIFAGGEPSKKTAEYASEVRERYVPYAPEEMSEWIVDWLDKRDTKITKRDALKIARHVGDDVDLMVVGINSLAQTYRGKDVDLDESMYVFKGASGADAFDLVKSIQNGDKSGALNVINRLNNKGDQNIYGLFSLVNSSMRPYTALSFDKNTDLEAMGIQPYRHVHLKREAASSTRAKGLGVAEAIRLADSRFFGGSSLSEYDIMLAFVIDLCRVFSR